MRGLGGGATHGMLAMDARAFGRATH